MKPHPIHHDKAAPAPLPARLQRLDELLDEALEETFPASDPVALSQPSNKAAGRRRHRD